MVGLDTQEVRGVLSNMATRFLIRHGWSGLSASAWSALECTAHSISDLEWLIWNLSECVVSS